jgi:hypothetical protein
VRVFLEREKQLGRNDLVLPIYYVEFDDFQKSTDAFVKQIRARQFGDWRSARGLKFKGEVGPTLDDLAKRAAKRWLSVGGPTHSEPGQFKEETLGFTSRQTESRTTQIDLKDKPVIQIFGWKGIEDKELYSDFVPRPLAFLTTQMSLENLPTFEYVMRDISSPETHDSEPRKFDVGYVDYEFVDRYHDLKRIHNLEGEKDKILPLFSLGKIAPAIMELMSPGRKPRTISIRSVPIQFGFSEILVNPSGNLGIKLGKDNKTKENGSVWTHSDFNLIKLLNDGKTKVAIWHWYLPSLLQFLLSAENTELCRRGVSQFHVKTVLKGLSPDPGNSSKAEKIELQRYHNVLETHVNEVCKLLKEHPDWATRIEVCSTMEEIRHELTDASPRAGVVLGQGSSVLSGRNWEKFAHVEAVVPKEQGILVWINCAVGIDTTSSNATATLVDHWFKEATQIKMCAQEANYFGLPTNQAALDQILNMPSYANSHAVKTFISLCEQGAGDETPEVGAECGTPGRSDLCGAIGVTRFPTSAARQKFRDGTVAHRVLPRQFWGQWVHLWEKFVRAANPEPP